MVPPCSDQVSRVWPYSGSCAAVRIFTYVTLTLFGWPSHAILLTLPVLKAVRTPKGFLLSVCPLPRSLATTYGISFDVSSDQVSRVWPYSGICAALSVFTYVVLTLSDRPSHAVRLTDRVLKAVRTPKVFLPSVCPLPRSLATTYGISFDVSSSPYLDVSVQAVPFQYLWIQYWIMEYELHWVAPFRYLRINGCLLLPEAFRSLPRLSSAPSAKAFTLRPF